MDVRIDKPREDLAATCINNPGIGRRLKSGSNAFDLTAIAVEVRYIPLTRGDDLSVANQKRHPGVM